MDVEHELSLDDVLLCPYALGVLDDGSTCGLVGVDEVGDVGTGPFEENAGFAALEIFSTRAILCRYQLVWYLLPQVGDKSGALHEAELACAVVFFLGGVGAYALVAVLVPYLPGEVS